ncbi:MAG: hypothetical protein JWP97_6296 [Labilithrix sp.]|nr:hypothetical protein [Labilithrix sp.]
MKVFHCDHCGQLLFFENVNCVRCGRALAFIPELHDLASLDPVPGSVEWHSPQSNRAFRLCENYAKQSASVCNWALPADDSNPFCRSCRLTRTIPNLSVPGNDQRWYALEVAKRRLVYTLLELGLPIKSRAEDPEHGLVFDFMQDALTGHANGVITVNVDEADEAERVRRRVELNETYRTLLGHFRHESGHYYWERLVQGTDRIQGFRDLFGDERADYNAALHRHYQGAPSGWQDRYISAYATMHPWEDWAETWAHYLHMTDTLETAAECGISLRPVRADEPALSEVPHPAQGTASFERLMDGWAAITYVLNNLNRGLGNGDAYPFVLSVAAVQKLRFVHETVLSH